MASTMWPLPSSGFERSAGLSRPPRGGIAQQEAHGGANGRIRKFGQRVGRPHYRPHPADVGQRDQKRSLRLRAAQQPHCLGFVLGGVDGLFSLGEQRRQMLSGSALSSDSNRAGSATARSQRYGEPSDSPSEERFNFRRGSEQALQRLAIGAPPDFRQPLGNAGLRRLAVRQAWSIADRRGERLSRPSAAGLIFFLPGGPCSV